MNKVISILMERDGMTKEEAKEQLKYVKEQIELADGDYGEVEDIMLYELGLEMDYIMDIL